MTATDTPINLGETVTIVVEYRKIRLESVFPGDTSHIVTYTGIVEKRAHYDEKDSIRLITPHDQLRLRVIRKSAIRKWNGEDFKYTPTQVPSRKPQEPKFVLVTGSSGRQYKLTIKEDGSVSCTCPGFGFRGKCTHVDSYIEAQNAKV